MKIWKTILKHIFKRGTKLVCLKKNWKTQTLNKEDEKIVKKWVEKRKIKRREVAQKIKLLKKEKSRAGQKK